LTLSRRVQIVKLIWCHMAVLDWEHKKLSL
jgi:hypothetical protein